MLMPLICAAPAGAATRKTDARKSQPRTPSSTRSESIGYTRKRRRKRKRRSRVRRLRLSMRVLSIRVGEQGCPVPHSSSYATRRLKASIGYIVGSRVRYVCLVGAKFPKRLLFRGIKWSCNWCEQDCRKSGWSPKLDHTFHTAPILKAATSTYHRFHSFSHMPGLAPAK